MGIRILASVVVLFAAFHAEAASLPAVPPLELADLTLRVTAPVTKARTSSVESTIQSSRRLFDSTGWLNERQVFAPEQRWVF